ncbi:response regulator [bacterium]|nr:response regulator [bacterium]
MALILIVDDDRLMLKFGEEALHAVGHVVETALNGREALELLKIMKFDLVITDLFMPEIDGFELISYLHTHMPNILILSQSAGSASLGLQPLRAAALMGVHAVLEKPYTPQDLVALVDSVLAESGRLSGTKTC